MSPFRLLRAALVPAAVAIFVTACQEAPSIPGGSFRGAEDDVKSGQTDKKKAPSKKTEPTDQPAPQGDTPPPATPQQDQAPTLASVLPEAITVGESPNGIELTLAGTRFPAGSQVDIAGTKVAATVVSAEQIKVRVPADLVKVVGALRVSVVAKPGLESNPLSFTVANPTSVTIASLLPANVILGAQNQDVALNVTGTGFAQQSVVRFNGAPLTTTFTSTTALKATIPSVAFTAAGRFSVTVATGANVVSLPTAFEVRNPSPTATQIAPASVTMGDGATVVTITGSKFTKASEVFVQNAPLATTFAGSTQLRATVPSYLITKEGTLSLTVITGTPGGGTSTALKLTVKAGQSTTTTAQCAYKCADYGYKPYSCYSNWYCIGTGANAGCLAQTTCTDTVVTTGNPNEQNATTCDFKCADYKYTAGECADGWYCRYTDSCLVQDSTCSAAAGTTTTTNTNACKWSCADYGYYKGECDQGYYCQYADGCLVADAACGGTTSGSANGTTDTGTGSACTYDCKDYDYQPGDCSGGYYCQYADNCLVADATCP